mmetsp:Transcript_17261/g.49314  ORF Transcript_17261/g.49314 Transcript_17261/m.49314 type:complete len:205 (-) Transcript_17261:1470-2084(-)
MGPLHVRIDPLLPIVCAGLSEGKVNRLLVIVPQPLEGNLMILDVPEVLLGLLCCAGSQAFVVLRLPALAIVGAILPLLVLGQGKEGLLFLPLVGTLAFLPDLDNWSHKLLEKAVALKQARPPVADEVDEKALDVGAIVVLICHQHDGAVAEATSVRVLPLDVEPHYLQEVHDLLVAGDLLVVRVPHVQDLPLQREYAVPVAAHD